MSKRTYYRGPDAFVTDELFVWRTTPLKSYAIRDLHNVGLVRAGSGTGSPVKIMLAGATTVVVIGTGWTMLAPPTAYAIGLLAVTVPLAFTVPSMFRRSGAWELHATYRGAEVVLYASADVQRFNQVVRALRRAIEDARPPERGLKLAVV